MSFSSKAKAALLPVAKSLIPGLVERRNKGWVGRIVEINEVMYKLSGGKILGGPFRGLQYLPEASGSALAPKLVGCYELEIQPALEAFIAENYDTVIDIGCAEGYYAVGLATRMPGVPIVAYDIDEEAIERCVMLAALNDVTVQTEAACGKEDLLQLAGKHAFVFSDCEGFEFELFDAEVATALAHSDAIIELHGPADPIVSAFEKTHDLRLVKSTKRNPGEYSAIQSLSPRLRKRAVSELRRWPQQWAIVRSRERLGH